MIAATAATRPRCSDAATVARMADFMLRHCASAGSVTQEDLLLDFTQGEIDANFAKAKEMARKRTAGGLL